MAKLIQAARKWWENRKSVVLDFVLPQLDKAVDPLAQLIASKGVPAATSKIVAGDVIIWVKEYLKRQL